MSSCRRPHFRRFVAATFVAAAALAAIAAAQLSSASAGSLDRLVWQPVPQQSRAQSLSASGSRLSTLTGALDSQISLVQSREAAVRADLDRDRAELVKTQTALHRE